ncbi:MAG: acyl-CoA mutase large subunit family protein [Puniceicoccales bacterium]|jgi:methylmalonyl-CoA mutase|nr:acyl-CoA mutase large subunit family protein [Puniceicoccales bacterium]
MPDTSSKLAAEFTSNTHAEWKTAAEALLKGAPFDKIMLTPTPEALTLQPIYEREVLNAIPATATLPGQDGFLRGTRPDGYCRAPWDIAQEIHGADPATFNATLLRDLAAGQNAVSLVLDHPGSPRLENAADFATAFQNVTPEAIAWHFHAGTRTQATATLFHDWLKKQNATPGKIRGTLNYDPLGTLAATGSLPFPLAEFGATAANLVRFTSDHLPAFTALGVVTHAYHNAGASAVEELGTALATGLAYLRALGEHGFDTDDAASQMAFHFSIGGNFFVELAKLRAARITWARIVTELGGNPAAQVMRQHARTGIFNKTKHDPCVNILRTTTEALGGVLGGIESLTIGAYDECVRQPDDLARRVARNTHIILQEECELTSVIDPSGGSWYVEKLTDDIAGKSWEFFQKIEAQGGAAVAIQNGFIQNSIAATRKGREKLLGQRRVSLVGTNQYPNIQEKPLPSTTGPDSAASPKKTGDTARETAPALPSTRLAARYEELRAAATAYKAKHGHGPKIHLANIGPLRRHKARADFTRGFFETGGFEITGAEGSTDATAIANAAIASGAQLIVICGHDEDYVTQVPLIAQAIKAKAPQLTLILAGNPGDNEPSYKSAGLDTFIFVKSDNYETNRQFLQKLGAL